MSKIKINIIRLLVTLIVGFLTFYIFLPVINIHDLQFWIFLLFIIAVYLFTSVINFVNFRTINFRNINNKLKFGGYLTVVILLVIGAIILTNLILSPVFNSKLYSKRIEINEEGNFENDIALVDFSKLPLLDKSSSQKLGDRVMGQMPELVSQFYVSNLYTQINYNDEIIRVTPLEYADFIKFFTNRKEGVKGYISVNSVNGETNLKKLSKGMKYLPSALFSKDLYRHLRFAYPTEIFGSETFEIDDEGDPYWIVPIMKYTGVGLKRDVQGIVILDPITGKSKKYSIADVPTWVDHVYSAELLIEQVNDWGKYKNGFFNSIFGQKGVVTTTEGYNYTVMNNDVYLYTGITSAASDEANLGFVLSNLRTKETIFYPVPGAEEYSAMASAEGQVQQMNYKATFPLIINLNNNPTYLISLKDNAGLVKMYAFVDVKDYQKVAVTDASKGIKAAAEAYLGDENIQIDNNDLLSKAITIASIKEVIIGGNSHYYIIDSSGQKYRLSVKIDELVVPFLTVQDKITVFYKNDKEVIDITKISK